MEEVSELDRILIDIASLAIKEPLKYFTGTDRCLDIWQAFNLGRMYECKREEKCTKN